MEEKFCSCGRPVARVWRVDTYEIDDRPFGSGQQYPIFWGYMGNCGQLHTHFEVYPRFATHQCQPVEISREHYLNQNDVPKGAVLLPDAYQLGEKPPLEHPILAAINKLHIQVENGQLVINLPSNGQIPPATTVNLTPAGCRIQILDLKKFASV